MSLISDRISTRLFLVGEIHLFTINLDVFRVVEKLSEENYEKEIISA